MSDGGVIAGLVATRLGMRQHSETIRTIAAGIQLPNFIMVPPPGSAGVYHEEINTSSVDLDCKNLFIPSLHFFCSGYAVCSTGHIM